MPKYRLTYGTNDEFYAQTAGEVVMEPMSFMLAAGSSYVGRE